MNKSEGQLLQEVHQAVLGVAGTKDEGIVGKLNVLESLGRIRNGRIGKAEGRILWLTGGGFVLASGVGVAFAALFSMLNQVLAMVS